MFGNGQYVIPAKPVLSAAEGAGIQIPVWTLSQRQIMPSAKIYYDWYYLFCYWSARRKTVWFAHRCLAVAGTATQNENVILNENSL